MLLHGAWNLKIIYHLIVCCIIEKTAVVPVDLTSPGAVLNKIKMRKIKLSL
jgi:hypothetical protein